MLTATNGSWNGSPTSFAYQWQRCDAGGANCSSVGSNSQAYVLVAGDVGSTMRVQVTATNVGGSTPATSAQTAVVQGPPSAPVNTVLPAISGTTTAGQQLSTTDGTWTGSPTPTFTYQWRQCDNAGANCTDIGGATNSTYTLVAGDVGEDDPGGRHGDERLRELERDLDPDRGRAGRAERAGQYVRCRRSAVRPPWASS